MEDCRPRDEFAARFAGSGRGFQFIPFEQAGESVQVKQKKQLQIATLIKKWLATARIFSSQGVRCLRPSVLDAQCMSVHQAWVLFGINGNLELD